MHALLEQAIFKSWQIQRKDWFFLVDQFIIELLSYTPAEPFHVGRGKVLSLHQVSEANRISF